MTKTNLKIACAPLAIAAMAALNATPASAQSQPQIVIDVPEAQTSTAQPATTAEPTVVSPDPAPIITEPVIISSEPIQTATPIETPAEAEPAVTTPRLAAALRPAAPSSAPAPEADPAPAIAAPTPPDESVSNTDMLPTAAAPVPSEAELAVARAELAPAGQPIEDGSTSALILALLGVGGIGLLTFFLMRRRRSAAPVIEKPVVTKTVEPKPAPIRDRAPTITTRAVDPAPAFAATASPSSGAAVELPPELPETFEERSSLLERMVAARPDRANPFRSPKARAKRARLIMQSIGTRFTSRKPRIDLSQYTNIWPELRGWRPATT
ncbi:hypothetical protein GRI69_05400 [Erythrobacter vulgaris]|uniref:LPXTG cell wall anchor domain-containing protein n=1 Tax=Qipengyuania vulgaris TaxID=291985 RepID=A0A844XQI6_9SPHN|nr:hypothetical protein [Qipengyuania vulgaris]MXO47684.1 hypothetical protein [Qipengyuania vulgaris]